VAGYTEVGVNNRRIDRFVIDIRDSTALGHDLIEVSRVEEMLISLAANAGAEGRIGLQEAVEFLEDLSGNAEDAAKDLITEQNERANEREKFEKKIDELTAQVDQLEEALETKTEEWKELRDAHSDPRRAIPLTEQEFTDVVDVLSAASKLLPRVVGHRVIGNKALSLISNISQRELATVMIIATEE